MADQSLAIILSLISMAISLATIILNVLTARRLRRLENTGLFVREGQQDGEQFWEGFTRPDPRDPEP